MAKGVTIKDVAAEAGVSFKTVSNVINGTGSMRESTRGRVLEAMDKLNYTINLSARSLKTGTTGLLGLAIFDFSQPFASYLADQIIVCAREHHYGVIINTYGQNEHGLARAMRQANNLAADGWIVFADHAMGQHSKMLDQSYPLVLTGDWDAYARWIRSPCRTWRRCDTPPIACLIPGTVPSRCSAQTARSAQDITDKPPRVRRNSACKGICRHTRSMASRPAWTCCSQVAY